VIDETSHGRLTIYNVNGVVVKSFEKLGKGIHAIIWDGTDNGNSKVAPGVYYLSLKSGDDIQVRKIIVAE